MNRRVKVCGAGSCLIDRIYNNVSFASPAFQPLLSRQEGDGGLVPGQLLFEEDLERHTGQPFPTTLASVVGTRRPDSVNIGGPCIVSLINAAQLTPDISAVSYWGCHGDDSVGDKIQRLLACTPIDLSHYRLQKGAETSSTTVFSDPRHDDGHGERTFVNTIGASWHFLPDELDDDFFSADIVAFGATAIVPPLHQALDSLLAKAKRSGCLTVVNTVYDSLNQRQHPDRRWPLGASDDSYAHIDVLVCDHEEALRLSGTDSIDDAMAFFHTHGTGSALVTDGAHDVWVYADSPLMEPAPLRRLPVSAKVGETLRQGRHHGDTTGCGDNFAGGVMASIIRQTHDGQRPIDMTEAAKWGIVSGGQACFYVGGTFYERQPGEKLALLRPLYDAYNLQTKEEKI